MVSGVSNIMPVILFSKLLLDKSGCVDDVQA